MTALFISDLHLTAGDAETTRRFVDFLDGPARAARDVYILGDLFEAWIGDDDTDPAMKPVVEALAALARANVPCRIMHGNHDFLLGRRFECATGATLLGDYEIVDLYGERVLLTHGDLLCTDDTRYMELRKMLRDPAWQRDFLGKPLAERKAIASQIRSVSLSESAAKPALIMDVNDATVEETMRRFGVRRLLHGHTHRPAVHALRIDGEPAERIVLGAWHEHGYVLHWNEEGYRVELI